VICPQWAAARWSLDILVSIHSDPKWVGLRKDPRFQQLEKKIGFSEGMN
jgi:hypothetical protein